MILLIKGRVLPHKGLNNVFDIGIHDLLNFDIISDILKWKVIQLLVNIEEFELMIRHRLRAVPPFRGFRFPGMRKERRDCRQHIKKLNTRCPHNAKFPLVEIDTPVNQI